MQPRTLRRANVKWFSTRQKRRSKHASPQQIVALRLGDFARLFRARYHANKLPDDDAGRDDIEPVIHHLAALRQPARRAAQWLLLWAPWLTLAEQGEIIATGIAFARAWTADELAWRYKVTKDERETIGLTTFGAIDEGKVARTKRRKRRDRERRAAQRRAAGAILRETYEGKSTERTKPWVEDGVSRRTWFRRQRRLGTGPSTA